MHHHPAVKQPGAAERWLAALANWHADHWQPGLWRAVNRHRLRTALATTQGLALMRHPHHRRTHHNSLIAIPSL